MHLPACFAFLILTFAPAFVQQRTWRRAELLLIAAILAPGKRTVTSLLRIAGLGRERRFTNYHRVLNRAAWDARAAARLLLGLLVAAFVPAGPVVLGVDDAPKPSSLALSQRRAPEMRTRGTGSQDDDANTPARKRWPAVSLFSAPMSPVALTLR